MISLLGIIDNGMNRDPMLPKNTAQTVTSLIGETLTIKITVVLPSGVPYVFQASDVVVLSMKKSSLQVDTYPGFKKTVDGDDRGTVEPGIAYVTVAPANTKNLELGQYVYDVWLLQSGGERLNLVPLSAWFLQPVATRA